MRLIIFDIDGTLANTDYEKDNCYAEAFQQVTGRTLEGLEYASCYHITDSAITDHFFQQMHGRNALPEELAALKSSFRGALQAKQATHPQFFEEIPGASHTFNYLMAQPNIHLGIATGAWRDPAQFKLETIGIPASQVPFVGADDSHSKEDSIRDVIALARAQYGDHQYQEILYVGDRVYDWQVSQKLGLGFIGVDYLGTGILKNAGVTKVLRELTPEDILG